MMPSAESKRKRRGARRRAWVKSSLGSRRRIWCPDGTAGFRGGIAETGDEIRFPVRGGGGIWLAAAVTIMPSNGAASCQP